MLALLVLLIPPTQADKVLDRNAQFMQKVRSLSVNFNIALVASPYTGKGRLVIEFPRRTRFEVKIGPIDYDLASSEESTLEIEHSTKYYMEDLPAEFVGVPSSKISYAPQVAFPGLLLRTSLRGALPRGTRFAYVGKSGKVDKLHAVWQGQTGSGEATAHVDAEGKVLKLAWRAEDMGQLTGNEMDFSNYSVNKAIPMSTFRMTIPTGYVPYVLPINPVPPEPGQKVQLGKWFGAGQKQIDLDKELGGQPVLLFVTSPDCIPSGKARTMVEALAKDIKVVELLSEYWPGPRTGSTKQLWGGPAMKVLAPPVTPSLYLIGGDGTMHRMWYGYDDKSRADYEKDIRESIKEVR